MKATRLLPEEYGRIFPSPLLVYDSVSFSELNRSKCDDLHYIVLSDERSKMRLGVILGEKDGMLRTPFSAPFGCIEETRPQHISYYTEAVNAIRNYAGAMGCSVRMTLPPYIYGMRSQINKQYLAALNAGAKLLYTDYSYAMPLTPYMDVEKRLSAPSRRNYKTSQKACLTCRRYDSMDVGALEEAYRIVTINHETRGYPVHMSLENLKATIDHVVKGSVYIVTHNGKSIAASINYHYENGIVQLIYWGNIPEAAEVRPMNHIAFVMANDFAHDGYRWFDLGPASIDGVPDEGLCFFKDGLGFELLPKPTLQI